MAVPPPPSFDKPALRARMRAARATFARTQSAAVAVPDRFTALVRRGLIVASYAPIGGEAGPTALAQAALDSGCTLALPHVTTREATLRFLYWHPTHDLADGPFGLRQPHADRAIVMPDVILTPLVAFDHRLHRLGQGAGHYDRAFADLPGAIRIGVAWSVQRVDALPVDRWDVPLHAVVTERGWIDGSTP